MQKDFLWILKNAQKPTASHICVKRKNAPIIKESEKVKLELWEFFKKNDTLATFTYLCC